MRVVVASCYKYRDTWNPFLSLFDKFHGGPITLLTDAIGNVALDVPPHVDIHQGTWCEMLAKFAATVKEPILFFQDDFFLNAPVNHVIVRKAADLVEQGAGCVRLYPCPGSDVESLDPYFGGVSHQADYRISCQSAVWSPSYLKLIAQEASGSPCDFELIGTPYSRSLLSPIFAYKRHIEPWPIQYLCSAVSRGQWNPDAKRLCEREGIVADFSMRPMAAA